MIVFPGAKPVILVVGHLKEGSQLRLGGPTFLKNTDPEQWIAALKERGYSASYCPIDEKHSDSSIQSYAKAARAADIVIAEVGAWSNPISPDEAVRKAAVEKCKKGLALAEEVGARCCVNIAGSRGAKWDGPCPDDLTDGTFEMIVEVVRGILDDVRPQRSCYALETMPWMYPDSVDAYLSLIRAIDRRAFAVHFDPVNLICSPQRYFRNGDVIRDFIERLGPHIRSCHAKDILLQDRLTVHLDEVQPGIGALDYRAYLTGLATLDRDIPLMLEHLPNAEAYEAGAAHIRRVASDAGLSL
jgi:sugar phosphate isomerase/epimerase